MFKDILNLLLAPSNEPLQDTDARLALSALLVRIARSDHDYAEIEKDRIDRILRTRFDLELGEATLLREQAEEMEAEAPDTVRFTRAIKEAVVYEERIAVVEAMWQVVLADGDRDPEEDALLRLATNLLGVNDVDSARIRQKVETDRSQS
ncbi:TerB family tellurite resistance protein [Epibacterium ulvae]|uniref:tellurite resistance TerB family protein n=1 Tax=Epibacterium ulvae TaxID=1156985 RepID=UPI00248F83D1|nr:TerB family tellurite resistance protein [Epibacterium ulvae]